MVLSPAQVMQGEAQPRQLPLVKNKAESEQVKQKVRAEQVEHGARQG